MHRAAEEGNLEEVRSLVANGEDVNAYGPDCPWFTFRHRGPMCVLRVDGKMTPLHLAASGGHVDVGKELLDNGADIDANTVVGRWKDGYSPICLAAKGGHVAFVALLVERGCQMRGMPLHLACHAGHLDVVTLLLNTEKGANSLDSMIRLEHNTRADRPLSHAARAGHVDIVKLLIARGADVNGRNDDAATPLHAACSGTAAEVVRVLVEDPRVDVLAMDDDGRTALDSMVVSDAVVIGNAEDATANCVAIEDLLLARGCRYTSRTPGVCLLEMLRKWERMPTDLKEAIVGFARDARAVVQEE